MRKLLLPLLVALGLCAPLRAQQTPITTYQLNTTYYVKQVPGFLQTIQSAVSKACAAPGATVDIPAGAAPVDLISAVSGGCTTAKIVDERDTPASVYGWNGSQYALVSTGGGGTPSPLTTKGDVWGFATGNARIPVGLDGQVFTADSTQPTGLKWAPAPGGLSGQTAGRIPLAASATTSTSSSSFFQSATTAGVFNFGFQAITTTGSPCKNRGAAFTLYACNEVDVYDDGTAGAGTAANLTGTNFQSQVWGSAGGGAGAIREGRTSTNINEFANGAMVHAGTKIAHVIAPNMYGIGDAQGLQMTMGFHNGAAYDSDQGSQMAYFWASEQGHWSATVAAGGTNTAPKVTGGGGCNTPQNQACAPSPGWVMLDTSVVHASGKITGACTTSSIPWMSSCATDQTTIPTATAWGTALNINLTSSNTWDTTTAQTFTIGAGGGTGSGSFAAGDHACVIGDKFFENRIITSVSGSAGAQTITIPLSRPEVSLAIFKGDCMHYVGDQNSAHNIKSALPTVSLDGAHILTSFPQFSSMIPFLGNRGWTTYDGGPNSGFHLYAGARVSRVDTSRPDFVPFDDAVISITLEPNSAFSVGDAIESPDFPAQKLDGMVLVAQQDTPSTDQAYLTGMHIGIGGHGANNLAAVLAVANLEPTTSFTPWGGPLDEPNLMVEENNSHAFGYLYLGQYTPLHSAFWFNNHQPGQTSYTFLRDPSWGQMDVRSDGFHFINVPVLSQDTGYIYAAGAMYSDFGMRTGSGDGGGNGAGLDFSNSGRKGGTLDTWLAQCDLTSDGSKTDLCVTSQGNSRTSNNVTADRSLQAYDMHGVHSVHSDGDVTAAGNISATGNLLGTGVGLASSYIYGTYFSVGNSSNGALWAMQVLGSGFDHRTQAFGFYNGVANDIPFIFEENFFGMGTQARITWTNATNGNGDNDTGISRESAGVIDIGNGAQGNKSGTINAATYGAGALANGMTATTQSAGDNSTKVATTAYVDSTMTAATTLTFSTSSIAAGTCTSAGVSTLAGVGSSSVLSASFLADTNTHLSSTAGLVITIGYRQDLASPSYTVCNVTASSWTNPGGLSINVGRVH